MTGIHIVYETQKTIYRITYFIHQNSQMGNMSEWTLETWSNVAPDILKAAAFVGFLHAMLHHGENNNKCLIDEEFKADRWVSLHKPSCQM